MKKILSTLLAFICLACLSLVFVGCGNETVKVRGKLYTMKKAYENGWLDENDLKSIACKYYDVPYFEENPYSGMFTSTEELTEAMETELKQAYLEQYVEFPEGDRSWVKIVRYYGTYGGNIVARIHSDYLIIDYTMYDEYIGGVMFKEYFADNFLVYHID